MKRPSLKELQQERQEKLERLNLQRKYKEKNMEEADHDFLIDQLKLFFTFM
jgi:hypothetical protein